MPIEKHRKLLVHNPSVTEAVLCKKLSIPLATCTRDSLIDIYLSRIREGGVVNGAGGSGSGKSRGSAATRKPVAKKVASGRAAGGGCKAESKQQMLERMRASAEAMCKPKSSETISIDGCSFKLIKELGAGADAIVFSGECVAGKHKGLAVVLKQQPRHKDTRYQITTERDVLTRLSRLGNKLLYMQEPLAYGCHKGESYVLVTGLLGADLLKLGGAEGTHSTKNVLVLAHQALLLFEHLHAANFLHRDVKPENLVLGCAGTAGARKLHLIDFGTAESLVDRNGVRRTAAQAVEGSVPYMAVTVHQKQPLGKRDDVESLVWTLLRLCLGKLPWEHGKVSPTGIVQHKLCVSTQGVKSDPTCDKLPPYMARCFDAMLAHVRALDTPEGEPDYAMLRKCVETAWKSAAFSPTSLAKADLAY
mmetsp:Transcript_74887/g.121700  ORF Transcript_74887/g.121700 Transcript_74887/m.121700 type:complete len:419 (+) Transcript_74887:322-1578(+)